MSASAPSSASLPAAGGRSFTGFTKLCKGLAVVLFLGHILIQLLPSAATYLALIPSRTIPFAWNLVTAGYIEQTIPGVIVSIVGLLLFGRLLEPLWGAKELLKFIFIINLSTSVCVFVTAIVLYYITQQEIYLPILDPIASIFHKLVCGRSEISEAKDGALDGLLPGSDSIEANRRRERGQRALEQRLAEKLTAVRSSEGTPQQQEDASDKV